MIHHSTADDVGALGALLAVAFDDDPIVNWFIRQDDGRRDAFGEFFRLALERQTLPFEKVYHWGDHIGAALWAPPGCWRLSLLDQVFLAPSIFRICGLSLLKRTLSGLQIMEKAHPHEEHVYLSFLCSHPDHRGKGIGKALLEDMTRECDEAGLPIYLENTKEQNEAFYLHHGFEVCHDIRLSPDAPYYAGMWRKPR